MKKTCEIWPQKLSETTVIIVLGIVSNQETIKKPREYIAAVCNCLTTEQTCPRGNNFSFIRRRGLKYVFEMIGKFSFDIPRVMHYGYVNTFIRRVVFSDYNVFFYDNFPTLGLDMFI